MSFPYFELENSDWSVGSGFKTHKGISYFLICFFN